MRSAASARPPSPTTDRAQEIDALVRAGRIADAQKALRACFAARPRRAELARLANLAWRASVPELGLGALSRWVRGAGAGLATLEERAEYAACLCRAGAVEEGLSLARLVRRERGAPAAARFHEIAALVTLWDYDRAMPLLKEHLADERLGEYERLVARLNYASCCVYAGHHVEASAVLRRLANETRGGKWGLLHGNALQIAGVSCLWRRRFADAERLFESAAEALRAANSLDSLFVDKWRAALALMRAPRDGAALAALEAVRALARERGHANTLRECDRIQAMATRDEGLLHRAYFGTPFLCYRRRLEREAADWATIPSSLLIHADRAREGELNLLTGEFRGATHASLSPGETSHRLLVALWSEAYRPLDAGTLHGLVFPNEFLSASSTNRVHQAIRRLRAWLDESGVPVRIVEKDRAYRVEAGCAVRLFRAQGNEERSRFSLRLLHETFGARPFSTEEAMGVLRRSRSAVQALVRASLAAGFLEAKGSRRGARYRFR